MDINKETNSYKKILIINFGGIGDLLLSTPALRALKAGFYGSEITLMVIPRAKDALSDFLIVDRITVFDKKNIFKALSLLLKLREEKFDLAVNMRTIVSEKSAKKMKLLLNIINPKLKAGRDTESRGCFFDIRIPETDIGAKLEMEYDIDTVKALGAEIEDRIIDLKINKEALEKVKTLLAANGVSEFDSVIAINPGGMPSRRWPIENLAKVIDTLSSKFPSAFVITGSKEESSLAGKLKNLVKTKVVDLTGKLSIKELAALIKRSNLFLSNDTGPMHIASILKTPLVAVLGPGDITRYDPRAISDKAVVLYKKVDCSPCNRVTCESMKCLKAIQPDEVIRAALDLLTIK